jgi:hypothetical protein
MDRGSPFNAEKFDLFALNTLSLSQTSPLLTLPQQSILNIGSGFHMRAAAPVEPLRRSLNLDQNLGLGLDCLSLVYLLDAGERCCGDGPGRVDEGTSS